MELKDRIRRAREAVGWTQERLAEEVGVNTKTVRNWESGRVPRRSVGAIEKALGVDLSSEEPRDVTTLDEASDGQLLQRLSNRLAERERGIAERDRQLEELKERMAREVADLNAEIERLRGDPSTAEGRWAARVRET